MPVFFHPMRVSRGATTGRRRRERTEREREGGGERRAGKREVWWMWGGRWGRLVRTESGLFFYKTNIKEDGSEDVGAYYAVV
jgi:hypothetical protein